MHTNSSNCSVLRILDIPSHNPCFHWEDNPIECEIEWPCEVRQYLHSILPLIKLAQGLVSYGTVTIIVLGLFLNCLSFYILSSSGLSKSGSGIYLVSLAFCDCGNLLANYAVGVARGHMKQFNEYFMENEWLCRFHAVFVEIFQLISAWLVVSFTVERCTAVWYPLLLRNTSRKKRARNAVIIVGTIFSLFSLSKLFLTGFERDSVFGYRPCSSHRYIWHGMAYVRVGCQTWIPTIMVFVFNCLMFFKIRKIKHKRKRLTEYNPAGRGCRLRGKLSGETRKPSFINRPSPTAPMLMAVSLTYLTLVFPLGLVQTIELFWSVRNHRPFYNGEVELRERYVKWKTTKLLLKYIRTCCFGLYQINFGINFFLYFAAGLQFRLHLQHKLKQLSSRLGIKWDCCAKKTVAKKVSTSTGTTSSILETPSENRATLEGKLYRKKAEERKQKPNLSPVPPRAPMLSSSESTHEIVLHVLEASEGPTRTPEKIQSAAENSILSSSKSSSCCDSPDSREFIALELVNVVKSNEELNEG